MEVQSDLGPQAYEPAFRRRALLLLLSVYVFNFLDRQVLNILAEPIRKELRLADWQLGMMSGLAFAVLYSVLGLPMARYAERGDRPRIIAAAVTVWGVSTAICGLGHNFLQLVVARVFVGIGEAGGTPPAHSLISEYTPRAQRASALAFYSLGIPIGSLLGLALGGVIADAYGWRAAFILVGLPGVVLATGALLVLREPRRASRRGASTPPIIAPFREAALFLLRNHTFWCLALGASTVSIASYGLSSFLPTFFYRNHGFEVTQIARGFGLRPGGFIGLALGLVTGVGGAMGTFAGGWLAQRFGWRDQRYYVLIPALALLLAVPFFIAALLAKATATAILLLGCGFSLLYTWYGPIHATAQSIVPPHYRATISAVNLCMINLLGLGCGPLMVGILSDFLNHQVRLGTGDGLRWAMVSVMSFCCIGSLLFWRASRSVLGDLVS